MSLEILNITAIIQRAAAVAQSTCSALTDFSQGSPLLALLNADAYTAAWLQAFALEVLRQARLSTAVGTEVDTFVGDWGLSREPAVIANGVVTFARITPYTASLILPGVLVKTTDSSQAFTVTTDTSNAAWSPAQGGYALASGTFSVDVPVIGLVAGSAGNVQSGAVTILASSINGIDSVSNAATFTGGLDPESDDALKARFTAFIGTLSKSTLPAVEAAITGVQGGLSFDIEENTNPSGDAQLGYFTAYINDGTTSPSSQLLNNITAAISATRPIGSSFSVLAAQVITANVVASVLVKSGYDGPTVQGQVSGALSAVINALPVGAPLSFFRVTQTVMDVPGVGDITALTVNSAGASITPTAIQVVRAGTITVS